MTAQSTEGIDCLAALGCLFDIIRTLKMGSCLTNESRSPLPGSPTALMGVKSGKNLKKRGFRNSSSENKRAEMLQRVPGRTLSNGSSEVASLYTQQGKKGTNQDAMIVWENFGSRTDTVFCGVFDGHGPFGHLVSKRVRDSLPLKLSAYWETKVKGKDVLREIIQNGPGSLNSENASVVSVEEEKRSCLEVEEAKKQPEIFQTLKESFMKAFKVMDRELKMSKNIDCFCSGTTAVTLVKQGSDLVIGNIGDSRAILATRDEDNSLIAVQLTVDLKPNLPAEAERIRRCKGRVFALQDEPEVTRVWLPNFDSPGLAMARAFGDFCLKDFGLISVPEISCRRLSEKDEFIVLATDGIWDVLSNKEVVDIVASSRTRPYAARKLVESAVRAWRSKYPTSKVDDCAVVCLFLDSTENNMYAAASTGEAGNERDLPDMNGLNRCGTVPSDKSVVGEVNEGEEAMDVEETASEYEEVCMEEVGKEWSALEGVARVNTLLTLPRFVPNKDDQKAVTKKRK